MTQAAVAMTRRDRVMGAFLGSVAGDALGAPFEFFPPGKFSRTFPSGVGEMIGGGSCGWRPAEWTDDTQMALLLAGSLIENEGINEADIFERFQKWAHADLKDIGISTSAVLRGGLPWETAAATYFAEGNSGAGNGSLMRTLPAAIFFAQAGDEATQDAARRISDLTHGDPAAAEGCEIYHLMIRAALDGEDPLSVLPRLVMTQRYMEMLAPSWDPSKTDLPNGTVWVTLAVAVWALRHAVDFATGMRMVIDLGGDTDTMACVAGGLLGAVAGQARIPARWLTALNGDTPGQAPVAANYLELTSLAVQLEAGAH